LEDRAVTPLTALLAATFFSAAYTVDAASESTMGDKDRHREVQKEAKVRGDKDKAISLAEMQARAKALAEAKAIAKA